MAKTIDGRHRAHLAGGALFALAAYGFWGLVPIYFKAVSGVSPLEVLAHRVVWCVPLLVVWLLLTGRGAGIFRFGRWAIPSVLATTALIATNWFVFIWAVFNGQVLQASLGYFINPLVSVVLGFVFLHERLRPWQWVSVALAAASVTYLTLSRGELPVVALVLAGSFGLYGLLRKKSPHGAAEGLLLETGVLFPLAAGYLIFLAVEGRLAFGSAPPAISLLLACAGPVTALPLIWFVAAARRLRLATMGLMQYLAPSLHFTLATAVYGEPFTAADLITFAGIWTALALYSASQLRERR